MDLTKKLGKKCLRVNFKWCDINIRGGTSNFLVCLLKMERSELDLLHAIDSSYDKVWDVTI